MRDSTVDRQTIHVAGLRLDRISRELWRGDRPLRLPEKPFLVLEALIERPGEVVSREELRGRLWPDGTVVDFDNNLNSAVASLRAALRDSARSPRTIETLPRIGYRLVAPVTSEPMARPRVPSRSRVLALAAAAVIVLIALGSWAVPQMNKRSVATRALAPNAAAPAAASPAATSAWQRGMYLQERGRPDDLDLALAAFETVVRLDPGFADAHAQRAETLVRMSLAGRHDVRTGLATARTAAARALALDGANATAHRVMAMTYLHLDWDLDAAAHAIEQALAAAPDDAHARLTAASWLVANGRYDAAVLAARRAVELDPGSHFVRVDLGWFLLAARRYDEAIVACEEALAVEPTFTPALRFLVDAHAALGEDARAVAAAARFMQASNVDGAAIEATLAGSAEVALVAFRRWRLERTEAAATSHLGLALRHAAVGNDDAALDHLRQAYVDREPFLIYLRGYRELDDLLADPRLEPLAARFGEPHAPEPRVRTFSGETDRSSAS